MGDRTGQRHVGGYSPHVPVAYFYGVVGNPTKFDVWFGGPDWESGDPNRPKGTRIVTAGTDPQGDVARAVIALGLSRERAVNLGLGFSRNAEVTYATGKSSRRFGLLKLVNGGTGRATFVDVARSAKRRSV